MTRPEPRTAAEPKALEPDLASPTRVTALLVGVVVVCIALSVLSFQRRVAAFQGSGLELTQTESGLRVDGSFEGSSLEPGDILVLINGREFSSVAEAEQLLDQSFSSDVAFMRGETLQNGMHRRPPVRVDFAYLVLALIGVAYLFIGLYTLLRGVDRLVVQFVLWCCCSALMYLVSPVALPPRDSLDHFFYLLDLGARVTLPPLTLHFFMVFPRPLTNRGGERLIPTRLLTLLYLPAALQLVVQLDLALGWRRLIPRPTEAMVFLLDRIELLLIVGFALMALVALIAQSRRAGAWEERRQLLWIAAGMAGGYIPFLLLYVAPRTVGLPIPRALELVAVLPLALVPLGFAWALLRYRLWDVAIILRNATTYTLTLVFGAIAFSLLSLLIREQIPVGNEWTRNLTTIAGGLLVAGLLVPTKQSIGSTLERFQYRGAFRRRQALADLGDELLHERDLETLCSNLTRQLEETMFLERCNLYLLQGDEFHPVTPESLTANFFLPEEAIGERFWELEWIRIEEQSLPTLDPDIEDELFAFGYRTAFPLSVRGRPVAILVTGYKEGHLPLTSADSDLIRQILNQAALAIENAQLLEQMQERLRQVLELKQFNEGIIESSPAGIAVLDEKDRVIRSNVAFASLVAQDRGALRHRPIQRALQGVDLPAADTGSIEIILTDSKGRERNVQLSVAALSATAETGSRVLLLNDVTELTQMERALQEKERLAALGVMAAGVAHEVNTPLTGISSYAQMLLGNTPEDDPRFALLKKMELQTFRASRIVGSLLELSRASQPSSDRVSLRRLVRESVDVLQSRLDERDVAVRIVEDWPETDLVSGNEGELLQVVNNLILNAAEAISDNSDLADDERVVEVEAQAEGNALRLSVLDRGPGIDPDDLPKIFRPFYSTKLDRGGTGLGLSISYQIVRSHNGDLTAQNRPEGGCRITITLPRHAEPAGQIGATTNGSQTN